MSTEEDQVHQAAVQERVAEGGTLPQEQMDDIVKDIEHRQANTEVTAPVAAPEAPKPLGERIADAASSFGDAVRHMTMADDSKHEKVVTLQKAQDAVNSADGIVAASRTDGLGAADALVSVVNEWKVAVASRG